jgi:DNA-binding cell septation regulator SpoVG
VRGRRRSAPGSSLWDGTHLRLTDVRLVHASPAEVNRGLIGWASCVLNDALRVDGITVRRTLLGNLAVSFPTRKDGWGQKHPILKPLNNLVRRDLQHQILRALGLEENATR